MKFEELLNPIGVEKFYKELKHKKAFYIKSDKNIFENYFSWEELDNYMNQINIGQWDRTPQLQVVMPSGRKWCKKKSQKKRSREEIFDLWNQGSSMIFTLSEFLNETLWKQCQEFEKHYGVGQANIYCSKQAKAKTFPIHADGTDNFLFHVRGKIRWYIYKEFVTDNYYLREDEVTVSRIIELDEGDMLYIPKGLFHRVETLSPRISISFHFREPTPGKPYKRNDWYDWKP